MYKETGSEEDFEYLKYYGRRLTEDLEQIFDGQVHIHKGSAYFLMGTDCRIGETFPGNNVLSDIVLLCCARIRNEIEIGNFQMLSDETIRVEQVEFETLLKSIKKDYGSGFTKTYREMPEGEFVKELLTELEKWTFIRWKEQEHQIWIYPSSGKMMGHYPTDFIRKCKESQDE